MVTASPPVSPSVVARILMIQKPSVICGTLATRSRVLSFILTRCRDQRSRPQLFLGKPGVVLPPGDESFVAAAKNIALGARDVGDADRVGGTRTQVAFTVAGVLPETPVGPGRTRSRLIMIVRDPKPAVAENSFIRGADAARIHDG